MLVVLYVDFCLTLTGVRVRSIIYCAAVGVLVCAGGDIAEGMWGRVAMIYLFYS